VTALWVFSPPSHLCTHCFFRRMVCLLSLPSTATSACHLTQDLLLPCCRSPPFVFLHELISCCTVYHHLLPSPNPNPDCTSALLVALASLLLTSTYFLAFHYLLRSLFASCIVLARCTGVRTCTLDTCKGTSLTSCQWNFLLYNCLWFPYLAVLFICAFSTYPSICPLHLHF